MIVKCLLVKFIQVQRKWTCERGVFLWVFELFTSKGSLDVLTRLCGEENIVCNSRIAVKVYIIINSICV